MGCSSWISRQLRRCPLTSYESARNSTSRDALPLYNLTSCCKIHVDHHFQPVKDKNQIFVVRKLLDAVGARDKPMSMIDCCRHRMCLFFDGRPTHMLCKGLPKVESQWLMHLILMRMRQLIAWNLCQNLLPITVAGTSEDAETLHLVTMCECRAIRYGQFATSESDGMGFSRTKNYKKDTSNYASRALLIAGIHTLKPHSQYMHHGLELQDSETQPLHDTDEFLKMTPSGETAHLEQACNVTRVVPYTVR